MSISDPIAIPRPDFAQEVRLARAGVRVLALGLDADPETVAALTAWLSPDELERACRCHFERDRRRFIVARARLRGLLGECLDAPPDDIEFGSGEHGKPRLGGRWRGSPWQFNLSRSDDLAVVALSCGGRVGIDVEVLREVRGAEEIAMHCFSPGERAAYQALAADAKSVGFLNCWTRKEAFVKALGSGMSYPYDRFDVSLAPGEPARLLRVDALPGEASDWRLDAFEPRPGFVAALASERHRSASTM